MTLTISYQTNRRDNRLEWFLGSLARQLPAAKQPIHLVIVDFYASDPCRHDEVAAKAAVLADANVTLIHTTPKPTVWQGPHRLTSRNYFAASNARNTAICLAPDGYICFVDDLSVLLPGWFDRVQAAIAGNYVVCGSYEKVKELVVTDGLVTSCTHDPAGLDHRIVAARKQWAHTSAPPQPYPCGGSWFFGCSAGGPVDAFLTINGFDESLDGLGYEDTACGFMLEKNGYKLFFDPGMATYESWELHFAEEAFVRVDKASVHGHKDSSNAYVAMLQGGRHKAPNYFPEGGIAALRRKILAGEPFPVSQIPEHHWPDSQPLRKM